MIHLQDNAYKKFPTSIRRLLMHSLIGNRCLQFLWKMFCITYKIWGEKNTSSVVFHAKDLLAIVKLPTLHKTLKVPTSL